MRGALDAERSDWKRMDRGQWIREPCVGFRIVYQCAQAGSRTAARHGATRRGNRLQLSEHAWLNVGVASTDTNDRERRGSDSRLLCFSPKPNYIRPILSIHRCTPFSLSRQTNERTNERRSERWKIDATRPYRASHSFVVPRFSLLTVCSLRVFKFLSRYTWARKSQRKADRINSNKFFKTRLKQTNIVRYENAPRRKISARCLMIHDARKFIAYLYQY